MAPFVYDQFYLYYSHSCEAKPVTTLAPKTAVNKIKTRDMRDSAWRALGRWMTQKDWSPILSASSCEEKFKLLMSDFNTAIDTFLPFRVTRKHPTDRPWITPKIKIWIQRRQSVFIRQGKNSMAYRLWRNKVQRSIKAAKYHYYHNKVAQVEQINPAKWWREKKKLTGQDIQLPPVS